ncbi:MAG: Rieske (2Fe-2S) protein [Methylophilaceae bacterium]|nr:Rieske (2Fe-2S) protein [Methylophilaceae bacterium]MDG2293235.1 Rieske (2Fe-2S) protein [Methylophilaceae bacterium]
MHKQNKVIFNSDELHEQSTGLRFDLTHLGAQATGFLIRFNHQPYAYVNQCAHMPVELDWNEGEFFTAQKDFLICATHGACYEPQTGECVFGPCKGKQLQALKVTEENNQIIIHLDV